MLRIIALFGFLVLSTTAQTALAAITGTSWYGPFCNNTGSHATDLHINFTLGTVHFIHDPNHPSDATLSNPSDAFHEGNGDGTTSIELKQGDGNGVDAGGCVSVKLEYHINRAPQITTWWWTSNGVRTSPIMKKRDLQNVWATNSASGDGHITVTVGQTSYDFFSSSGDDGITTAQKFTTFILNVPSGEVLSVSETAVMYTADSFESETNIAVQVLSQDSTQAVTVREFTFGEPVLSVSLSSATNLVINGTNALPGATYITLASTDVGVPLTNWTALQTDIFDLNGNFTNNVPITPGIQQQFFLVQLP